jgi:CBS domain-containing protein
MKVKEVMTAETVKSCNLENKLHEAAKIMKDSNCGALPVVDREKRVVGMLTDRDICLALSVDKGAAAPTSEVHTIMSRHVHTAKEEDDLSVVLREMRTHQIGRIPVVDDTGRLKGIVSLHNLLSQAGTDGKLEMGSASSSNETLMKTIHAITDRYSKVGATAANY